MPASVPILHWHHIIVIADNLQFNCYFISLFRLTIKNNNKKTIHYRSFIGGIQGIHCPRWFPSQIASNAENVPVSCLSDC